MRRCRMIGWQKDDCSFTPSASDSWPLPPAAPTGRPDPHPIHHGPMPAKADPRNLHRKNSGQSADFATVARTSMQKPPQHLAARRVSVAPDRMAKTYQHATKPETWRISQAILSAHGRQNPKQQKTKTQNTQKKNNEILKKQFSCHKKEKQHNPKKQNKQTTPKKQK